MCTAPAPASVPVPVCTAPAPAPSPAEHCWTYEGANLENHGPQRGPLGTLLIVDTVGLTQDVTCQLESVQHGQFTVKIIESMHPQEGDSAIVHSSEACVKGGSAQVLYIPPDLPPERFSVGAFEAPAHEAPAHAALKKNKKRRLRPASIAARPPSKRIANRKVSHYFLCHVIVCVIIVIHIVCVITGAEVVVGYNPSRMTNLMSRLGSLVYARDGVCGQPQTFWRAKLYVGIVARVLII